MHRFQSVRTHKLSPICSALAVVGLVTFTSQLQAATFTVTTNADSGAGSLRDAVAQANTAAGADIIVFASGVTNVVLSSQIDITDVLTITGNGTAATVVSGNNATRIFNTSSPLTLNSLTLTNGSASGDGGAINVQSYGGPVGLTLNQVLVQNSTATNRGGGVYFYASADLDSLRVSNSTFIGNSAPNADGGGLWARGAYGGTVSIVQTRFHSNSAGYGGAAVRVSEAYGGTILLDQLVVTSNTANPTGSYGGGAIELNDPEAVGARVSRSYFANNTSGNVGGALLVVGNDETVIIENNTFVSNTAAYGGGAVYLSSQGNQITFRHNTVVNNTSNSGAVYVENLGAGVVLENSIIVGNQGSGDVDVTLDGSSPEKAARVRTAKDQPPGSVIRPRALDSASSMIVGVGTGGTTSFPAANGNQYGASLASVALGVAAANGASPVGAPGFTSTPLSLMPGPTSIAIDRGSTSVVTVDQNGNPRALPGRVGDPALPDIGAVEALTAVAASVQPVPTNGVFGLGVIAAALASLGAFATRRRREK